MKKKQEQKKQSGLTWTQIWLIVAIIFGVHQAIEKQQLQNQMSKCICTWEQAIDAITKNID